MLARKVNQHNNNCCICNTCNVTLYINMYITYIINYTYVIVVLCIHKELKKRKNKSQVKN